jgi:hypothetical protein
LNFINWILESILVRPFERCSADGSGFSMLALQDGPASASFRSQRPVDSALGICHRPGFGRGLASEKDSLKRGPPIELPLLYSIKRMNDVDRLPQPLHGEFDILRLQLAPALDLGNSPRPLCGALFA